MFIEWSSTRLGLRIGQVEAVALAQHAGFASVEPDVWRLVAMDEGHRRQLVRFARTREVAFGTAMLPVEFRHDAATFAAGMRHLPDAARALRAVGCNRVCAYLPTGSNVHTYAVQFRALVPRLQEIAGILAQHGIRLGLKYIGAPSSQSWVRHPFARSVRHVRDIVRATRRPNVGIALDAWHWFAGGDDLRDLGGVRAHEIVVVDLADAAPGVPRQAQLLADSLLPGTTRIIDNEGLVALLRRIGYMGPVRVEAYGHGLQRVAKRAAAETVAAALKNLVRAPAELDGDEQDTMLFRTLCA